MTTAYANSDHRLLRNALTPVDLKVFKIQTTRGTFEWMARDMLSVVTTFNEIEVPFEVIGIEEIPS